jgi:uncharacterized protein YdcH (DUF465 family)
MTKETLTFLRDLTNKVTLQASDPQFRTFALQLIAAQDELDKEITEADVGRKQVSECR